MRKCGETLSGIAIAGVVDTQVSKEQKQFVDEDLSALGSLSYPVTGIGSVTGCELADSRFSQHYPTDITGSVCCCLYNRDVTNYQ